MIVIWLKLLQVAAAAEIAKEELAAKNITLKHNPTAGIEAPAPHPNLGSSTFLVRESVNPLFH